MPEIKTLLSRILREAVSAHPDQLNTDGIVLNCIICDIKINFKRQHGKNHVQQHFQSISNQNHLKLKKIEPKQAMLTTLMNNSALKEYFTDLTKCFIDADIPMNKLKNESLRNFLQKCTKKKFLLNIKIKSNIKLNKTK
jgi:hypothetical protein